MKTDVHADLYNIDITSFLPNLPEALPEQANKRCSIVGCAFNVSKFSEHSMVPVTKTGETAINKTYIRYVKNKVVQMQKKNAQA